MTPFVYSLAFFGASWIIGLAVLSVARAEVGELRVVLTAPCVGGSTAVLPLFVLSKAGVSMSTAAPPVVTVLILASLGVLAWRRPVLSWEVLGIVGIAVLNLVLVGRPFLDFGFDWIANANDDMANYVLSATDLVHHGLLASRDVVALATDRDYPAVIRGLHAQGARPGSDITLAAFSAVSGRPPFQLFMPLILAFSMSTVCATAALAMQATARARAAFVAALAITVSPLAAYSVEQQLLPQVWGLGMGAAIFALLMREELHIGPGPKLRDLVPIGILVVALLVIYVELAASLTLAYALYVVILAVRRRIGIRAVCVLWGVPAVAALILLNTYLFTELRFIATQTVHGTSASQASPFAFAEVPAALPAIVGLEKWAAFGARHLDRSIAVSILVLLALGVGTAYGVMRRQAASVVLVADFVLGVYLGTHDSAFGLFKIFMYVQPFIAAGLAVWVTSLRRPFALVAAGCLVALGAFQFRTEGRYVEASRNPIDLHNASHADLLPRFRAVSAGTTAPIISVTENPSLAKLEAVAMGKKPLYFVSVNVFADLIKQTILMGATTLSPEVAREFHRFSGWHSLTFDPAGSSFPSVSFEVDRYAMNLLASKRCQLVLPSGSLVAFNRLSYPEGTTDLLTPKCGKVANYLVFTSSSLGQSYYTYTDPKSVSFYQLEPDSFFPKHTFSSFGRYLLFRVLDPSPQVRVELSLTTTPFAGVHAIPPASVTGDGHATFPVAGVGSARVVSGPVKPFYIDGQAYLMLDMGTPARRPVVPRHGLESVFGAAIPLDPRWVTSYVRDISIVPAGGVGTPPSTVQSFPADLGDPGLVYSGYYEQGYVGASSYLTLRSPGSRIAIRGALGTPVAQRLTVTVNGKQVWSDTVTPGPFHVVVPDVGTGPTATIRLLWADVPGTAGADQPLKAQVQYIGPAPG